MEEGREKRENAAADDDDGGGAAAAGVPHHYASPGATLHPRLNARAGRRVGQVERATLSPPPVTL